jgi:hypothetical protein
MPNLRLKKTLLNGVRYYKATALLFFNTLVLFALANGVLFVAYRIKDSSRSSRPEQEIAQNIFNRYGESQVMKAYPGSGIEDVRSLLEESWGRTVEFEPFTQFKERPQVGKWVNIDENGFRRTKNNGPWPLNRRYCNIFAFGGSTTFGYGVADDHTIASYLQEFLQGRSAKEVKVYNFGRCWYYSNQERVLFCNLLAQGHIPDAAVFLDGLNEFINLKGEPMFTADLHGFVDRRQTGQHQPARGWLSDLPMARLANSLRTRLGAANNELSEELPLPAAPEETILAAVIERYAQNRRLTRACAREYNVRPVFVWQPVPTYKYDLRYHLWPQSTSSLVARPGFGYPLMARTVKTHEKEYGEDFLWLADMQEQMTEPLYVDACHYTARFSKEIAIRIGNLLLARQLLVEAE